MRSKKKLKDVSSYSTNKVNWNEIKSKKYISTENMLQNKKGVLSNSISPTGEKVVEVLDGDVLLSNIRPYLKKIYYANEKSGCSTDVLVIRNSSDEILNKFLYYYLFQEDFFKYFINTSKGKGTKMPRGNKEALMNFPIEYPNLKKQKKIVSILSSLDKKIELNNQINQKLEELTQTLYQQWFVSFEFPNVESKPYRESGGEMVESELGMIPKGWFVDEIKNHYTISYGKGLKTSDLKEKGFSVYGSNGIIGYYDKKSYDDYQILVGCRGTVGNVIRTLPDIFVTNNSLIFEQKNDSHLHKEYIYYYSPKLMKKVISGSVQKQITIDSFNGIKIIVPNEKTVRNFVKLTEPFISQIHANIKENQFLTEIRDTILPYLMNGTISIK